MEHSTSIQPATAYSGEMNKVRIARREKVRRVETCGGVISRRLSS